MVVGRWRSLLWSDTDKPGVISFLWRVMVGVGRLLRTLWM